MPLRNKCWLFTEDYISKVPEGAAVYELCNSDQVVVFIGSSKSSIKRLLRSHKRTKKCIGVKYFRYKCVKLADDVQEEEKKLIKAHVKKYGKLPVLAKRSPIVSVRFG